MAGISKLGLSQEVKIIHYHYLFIFSNFLQQIMLVKPEKLVLMGGGAFGMNKKYSVIN
jgi:hypothetical protein